MSQHRAERGRARYVPRHSAGRRTSRRGRTGHRLPWSAAVGGLALVVAGVGATALGQPAPGAVHGSAAAALTRSAGGGTHPGGLPRLSRGADRSPVHEPGWEEPVTEGRAEARSPVSAPVAGRARSNAVERDEETWVLPTRHFTISTWFGEPGWYWASGYHTGIDFVAPCGTPELAVTAARVARVGWDGPYGNQVRLRLPDGDQVWYNHLTKIATTAGATLARGGLVGLMGETGNAYGCHLHLEYRLRSNLHKAVDPAPYFAAHGIRLHALQRALAATS